MILQDKIRETNVHVILANYPSELVDIHGAKVMRGQDFMQFVFLIDQLSEHALKIIEIGTRYDYVSARVQQLEVTIYYRLIIFEVLHESERRDDIEFHVKRLKYVLANNLEIPNFVEAQQLLGMVTIVAEIDRNRMVLKPLCKVTQVRPGISAYFDTGKIRIYRKMPVQDI
jgi:hypothetical protein